jgi:hypothetical protein
MQVDRTFSPAGGKMAGSRDPWPLWAQEASGTSGGPSIGTVLLLLAVVAALLVALTSGSGGQAGAREPERGSLCAEHRGDPGWQSVCKPR